MYIKCIELGLLKVDGNYLVKDFIYIIELIILSWSEYKKKKFKGLNRKRKKN